MRRRSFLIILGLIALVGTISPPRLLAAPADPPPANVAPCPVDRPDGCLPSLVQQPASPEQQLADRYAPIVMLKEQKSACDSDGEAFLPAPVDVVLGSPDVVLRQNTGTGSSADDPVIVEGPTAADLAGKGDTYYLDFPGNPRAPGCTYERWFKERMQGREPVTYAHIVSFGTGRVALQYWFFFVFNDFNNTHESDWEMIQVLFAVSTVEEALRQDPVEVAVAQHGGGETAAWDDPKLSRDGNHPMVYVAAGSHATHFGSATYLGWGANGTGFGCDITTSPSRAVPLTAIVVPDSVSGSDDPFAWTAFRGRWGERQVWEYNGPFGPGRSRKWIDPFTWQDGLRDSSLEIEAARTFGPGPTGVFCDLTQFGSTLLTRYQVYPRIVLGIASAIVLAIGVLLVSSRRTIWRAWAIYVTHWHVFALLGLVLIPIGLIANGFQVLVLEYPPGSLVAAVMNGSPVSRLIAALTVGGFQQLVGVVIVGPAVIHAYATIEAGDTPTFRQTYREVLRLVGPLFRAVLRPTLVIILLALSIVGIPWAIMNTVRWLFVSQTVMLDGVRHPADALARSEGVVRGHWLRTALTDLALILIAAAPGPIIGLAMLIVWSRSVEFANAASSVVYAVLLPVSVLGVTVLYRELAGRRTLERASSQATPLDLQPGG